MSDKPQRCETTLTMRYPVPCNCGAIGSGIGPCVHWEPGANPERCPYCDHVQACHHKAAAWLEKNAAASETQRWIPIGESLPAIGKNVAILISDKSVAIEDWPTSGYLYPGVEWWAGVPGNYINLAGHKWNVTAWMPLPEAKK